MSCKKCKTETKEECVYCEACSIEIMTNWLYTWLIYEPMPRRDSFNRNQTSKHVKIYYKYQKGFCGKG